MRILVTGAGGRIGTHLVKELEKENDVIIFDRKNGYDLLNKDSINSVLKDVDLIYHLAALVSYTESKDLIWKINVEGTRNLLNVAVDIPVIYMSSTAVYGKKLSKIPADENSSLKPTDFYGKTKLEAEKLVLKSNGISLRCADIYGPSFEEGYFKVFELLERGKMVIFGSGKNKIQYLHINDAINALFLAKDRGKHGEAYNITGSDIMTQQESLELVCKYLGVEAPKKHISPWLAKLIAKMKGKEEMVAYIEKLAADRAFDISKAKSELNFEPKVKYKTGVEEVVEEYKNRKKTAY